MGAAKNTCTTPALFEGKSPFFVPRAPLFVQQSNCVSKKRPPELYTRRQTGRAEEAQTLAHYSNRDLTLNVYGRTRDERLSAVVETIAGKLESEPDRVPAVYRQAVGSEQESATPFDNRELRLSENGGGGGNRTRRYPIPA